VSDESRSRSERARLDRTTSNLEAPTPSPAVFWSVWHLDVLAIVMIVVAVAAYGRWLVVAHARGHRWPWFRTLAFAAAVVLFGLLQFGIVGLYDRELRWAFTIRLALLFFAVPTFAALGAPIALIRLGAGPRIAAYVDRALHSRFARILGNAIVSPIIALVLFCVLLTPLSATIRTSSVWEVAITILVPMLGFVLLAPISEPDVLRSSTFVTAEFLLAFVELMLDAIPGIVLRITNHVLDGAGAVTAAAGTEGWWPSALRDQHLAGDVLWFIAEIADIPVLIALFVRWQRTDRHEARAVDELSDEEVEALTQEHLNRFRQQ
jgi:putative membrane protein